MKVFAVMLVGLFGCKAKERECPPAAPAQAPAPAPAPAPTPAPAAAGVDPVLVEALCALSTTPAGSGTGNASAGVVTNGKERRPWIARTYEAQYVSLEALERDLFLLKDMNVDLLGGMYPSSLCGATSPVFASLVVSNATHEGKRGTWFLGGDITKYEKKFVEGDLSSREVAKHAVAPVIAAFGEGTKLEELAIKPGMKTTGVKSSWLDAFEK